MFGARFGRRGGGVTGPAPQPVVAADGTVSGIGAAGPVVVENVTTGARAILTAGDGDNLFALARAAGLAATGESVRLADTTAPSGAALVPPEAAPSVRAILGQSEDSIALFLNAAYYTAGPYPALEPRVDAAVAIRATDDKSGAATIRALDAGTVAARDVNPGFVAFANLWHVGSGGVPLRLVGLTMPGTSMADMMDDDPAAGSRAFADDAALVALAEAAWGPVTDASYVWWNAEASAAKTLTASRTAHFFGLNAVGSPYDFAAGPLDHCLIDATGGGRGLLSPAARVHLALPGPRVEGYDTLIDPPMRGYLRHADGSAVSGMRDQNAMPAVEARHAFLAQAPAAHRGAVTLAPVLCRFGDYEGGVKLAAGQTAIHPAMYDADGQILFAQHLAAGELIAAGHLTPARVKGWERSADGRTVTMVVALPPGATLTTIRRQRGLPVPAAPRPHQQPEGMGFAILRDADRLTSGTAFETTNLRNARPLYRSDAADAALYPAAFRGTVTIADPGTDTAGGREGRVRVSLVEPLSTTERVYFCADGGAGSWNLHGIPDHDARLYLDGLIAHVPALAVGSHPYPGLPVEPQAMAVAGDMAVVAGTGDPPPADTTAPVLSAASVGAVTPTDAPLSVTTDEAGGTLYAVEVPAADPAPDAAQVAAGQDSTGAAALVAANVAVTAAGVRPVTLVTSTSASVRDRVAHLVQADAAGNLSNVVSVAYTRPAAAPAATEFRFAGDYLRDPANVPPDTSRIEHVVRFRAVTTYGAAAAIIKPASQESLACDLGYQVDAAGGGATLHVALKDGDNTTLHGGKVAGAVLPAVGTWIDASLDWNLGAGTATATLNGVAYPLTLSGPVAPPTALSSREIAYGANTSGGNKVPADVEFAHVETWLTTGGVRTRRALYGPAEFEAEKASPTGWFVDATP